MKFARLKHRMEELSIVEPNDFGFTFINNLYRGANRFLKDYPFFVVIPVAFGVAIVLYLLFGYLAIRLVSVLQNGF